MPKKTQSHSSKQYPTYSPQPRPLEKRSRSAIKELSPKVLLGPRALVHNLESKGQAQVEGIHKALSNATLGVSMWHIYV